MINTVISITDTIEFINLRFRVESCGKLYNKEN